MSWKHIPSSNLRFRSFIIIFFLDDGCVSLSDGDQSFSGNIKYLEMKWYETPSVVKFAGGKFQARFSRTHGHDIFKPRQFRVE